MASIQRYLSPKQTKDGRAEIFLRISLTRDRKLRIKSGVFVKATRFKNGEIIKPRANQKEIALLHNTENALAEIERNILDYLLNTDPATVPRETIEEIIDRYHHPERYREETDSPKSFFDIWSEFLELRDLSKNREDIFKSLARALHRYEAHRRETKEPGFTIGLDTLTAEDIMDFERFYRDEWRIYDLYPDLYLQYPAELRTNHKTHRPQRRGDNIVVNMIRKIRTFYNWCNTQGLTTNRPFDRYTGNKTERYGTPYYLTMEERDRLADFDFRTRPGLETQRDIFIFQCLIGCRVSDLMRLKKTDIVDGAVEYIAEKTKKERSTVIRVPLNKRAKYIIEKYAGTDGVKLLPFISAQRYNDAIKEMCRLAGIDRKVTIINPTTGEEEKRPIYELASSHMARRTFVGNLYKKVKDPNLVGTLSGHKEGSKAFARYRDIDEDMKQELVDLLN